MASAVEEGLLSAVVLWSLFVFITLTLLVWRRHLQPLKFRAPWLVVLSGAASYVSTVWVTFYFIARIPESDGGGGFLSVGTFCSVWQWMQWVSYPSLVIPYALRSYRIVKIFSVSRPDDDLRDPQQSQHSQSAVNPKYWDGLVVRESYLFALYAGVMVLLLTARVILYCLSIDFTIVDGYGCDRSFDMLWLGLHVVEIVGASVAIYQLRRIRDDYGISRELTLVAAVWILATLTMFVTLALRTGSLPHQWFGASESIGADTYETVHAAFTNVRNMLALVISCALPLAQTYSSAQHVPTLWSNCDALRSLDSLLKDIVCIQYFRKFLTENHNAAAAAANTLQQLPGTPHTGAAAPQVILCWVEIELFKDLPADELYSAAYRIWDKYLGPSAELQVACSAWTRKRVLDDIEAEPQRVTPHTFDDVSAELFGAMNAEFPKFLASDACRECLQQLESEEHLREILSRSDMI